MPSLVYVAEQRPAVGESMFFLMCGSAKTNSTVQSGLIFIPIIDNANLPSSIITLLNLSAFYKIFINFQKVTCDQNTSLGAYATGYPLRRINLMLILKDKAAIFPMKGSAQWHQRSAGAHLLDQRIERTSQGYALLSLIMLISASLFENQLYNLSND